MPFTLSILPDTFAVCRLDPRVSIPSWVTASDFFSITRTQDELSIVCHQSDVPSDTQCESGWRCLEVDGPLDLTLTGILAALAVPLAKANIPIFAISTFDTDYLLVKEDHLQQAIDVLRQAGHEVR